MDPGGALPRLSLLIREGGRPFWRPGKNNLKNKLVILISWLSCVKNLIGGMLAGEEAEGGQAQSGPRPGRATSHLWSANLRRGQINHNLWGLWGEKPGGAAAPALPQSPSPAFAGEHGHLACGLTGLILAALGNRASQAPRYHVLIRPECLPDHRESPPPAPNLSGAGLSWLFGATPRHEKR